jgi:putative ABC transport system permease protein
MRRVTLRSLWEHKRRLVSTVLAILLGVAFMSGTFVLADTLDKVFDDLFADVNEGLDARVEGEVLFSSSFGGDQRARLDENLVDTVAEVEGVAAAEPFVQTIGFGATNRVLDAEGDAIGAAQGPPTLLQSWVDNDTLNPFSIDEGNPPAADDEIVLNVAAAEDGEFELGDTVTVSSQFGNSEYTLVGTVRFGEAESSAGAVSANFSLAEAQRLAGAEGQLNAILVDAEEGVTQEEVVGNIREVLPPNAEVITGEEAASEDAASVQEGFAFFRTILTIFGAIALLVGIFIISNTFAILVAQRTRELALLRAVGASRAQVLWSVLLEALVVGAVAAVLGLLGGVALAAGITALLKGLGVDLPTTTLVVSPQTVIIALVAGLGVTVIAALLPAVRATRVPPLAALRDVAIGRGGASRIRLIGGILVLLIGGLFLSRAWTSDGDTDALPTVGLGALLVIIGAIVIGPVLAGPSVRTIGAVLPRLRGVTGRLAMENAARSPKRTSATASALLIGVALIGFITVFAASAKASVESEVNRGITADLIVQASGGGFSFSGFSPAVPEAVAEVDGVESVTSFGFGEGLITYPDGDTAETFVGTVDPETVTRALNPEMEDGSITDLENGGIVVDRQIAEDSDLAIGDPILLTAPGGGTLDLEIQAISDDLVVLGFWTLTEEDWATVVPEQLVGQTYAGLAEGADLETVQADVEAAISQFPELEVLTLDEFIGDVADQLTGLVNFIYGLLGLSIVIAMIGVANTISLSVHERTRELGLLRAVGMDRGQVRSAIRWEAVIISVLGTLVGLALGLVLSRVLIQALKGFGLTSFSLPFGSLVVWLVAFALLGVLASLLPARRAAKLDVLKAIATE